MNDPFVSDLDRARESVDALAQDVDTTAAWNAVEGALNRGSRGRRRRGAQLAAVLVSVVAIIVGVAYARHSDSGSSSLEVTQSGPATNAQDTTTTAGSGEGATGPRTDLVGDSPGIAIDHTGAYTWTSAVVLRLRPEQLAWSYHVDGQAQISGFGHTLISVSGGYSLKVWFTVNSFSGSPHFKVASVASGSVPPGLIAPPTVATSTSLSGGN